jgi:hypothetical protein
MYSDPNQEHAQYHQPQQDTYAQPQQQQYTGTPAHPQETYKGDPQHYAPQQHQQQPGMPPQQASGMVYQNATPIPSLNRSPAPADCPACGQRALTNCSFETGNTNQYVPTLFLTRSLKLTETIVHGQQAPASSFASAASRT